MKRCFMFTRDGSGGGGGDWGGGGTVVLRTSLTRTLITAQALIVWLFCFSFLVSCMIRLHLGLK